MAFAASLTLKYSSIIIATIIFLKEDNVKHARKAIYQNRPSQPSQYVLFWLQTVLPCELDSLLNPNDITYCLLPRGILLKINK